MGAEYYKKITPLDFAYLIVSKFWAFRIFFVGVVTPLLAVTTVAFIQFRREPCETYIEREEWFRDFPSNYYGVYFDHHHFAHRLAVRSERRWVRELGAAEPFGHLLHFRVDEFGSSL